MSIFSKFCPTSLYFVYILVIISTFFILYPPFLYYVQLLYSNDNNSSNCLPCSYEQKVLETNHGSFISIDVVNGQFKRLYVSYGAWVEGFRAAYRPLLFLDGIFLITKVHF